MRISDWSSDVCSSDLRDDVRAILALGNTRSGITFRSIVFGGPGYGLILLVGHGLELQAEIDGRLNERGYRGEGDVELGGQLVEAQADGEAILANGDRKSTRLNSSH